MNHRKLLGLPEKFSHKQLKTAYRAKVKIFHPDINHSPNAHEMMGQINLAYEQLIHHTQEADFIPPEVKADLVIKGELNRNGDGSLWDFIEIPRTLAVHGGMVNYIWMDICHKLAVPRNMRDGQSFMIFFEEYKVKSKAKVYCRIV